MKLPEFGFLEKCKIVGKTLLVQVCLFITLLLLAWGSQALYAKIDRTEFPTPVQIAEADKLDENAKGKALVDAITHQMRYELDSTSDGASTTFCSTGLCWTTGRTGSTACTMPPRC